VQRSNRGTEPVVELYNHKLMYIYIAGDASIINNNNNNNTDRLYLKKVLQKPV
jgi:hypothetical protein